ncbi:MAG TPA: vWA domain-containing protein [Polyangiales bacterium]|nr:vWA domain-containing protein [Polyangiales bacterium]
MHKVNSVACGALLWTLGAAACSSGSEPERSCSGSECKSPLGASGTSSPASAGSGGLPFGDSGIMLPDAAHQDLDASLPKNVCARSDVVAGRVTPNVILIIDQSGSMTDSLGSGSRWNVLRDFLLKDDGLIKTLQDKMRFGIAMYSARSEAQNGQSTECPLVTSVAPALNNFQMIADSYRKAEPIDETPTGDAITKILGDLPKPAPDAPVDPTIFVLATDGEPDRCEELNPQNGQAETLEAVQAAYAMNIKTFVIGVGNEISKMHQQDVANAGVGQQAGQPNAPYWTATDDQTLRTALMDIISAQISCDIALKGRVEGDACSGTVELSGKTLICKSPDGWELLDPTHVRLLGAACSEFRKDEVSTLHVTFPCEVIRPI